MCVCRQDTPFHVCRKRCHHIRSDLKSAFRRIGWSRCLKEEARLIIRRRNGLPSGTTLVAYARRPTVAVNKKLTLRLRLRDHATMRTFVIKRQRYKILEYGTIDQRTRKRHAPGRSYDRYVRFNGDDRF